jgi:hypothetical protein
VVSVGEDLAVAVVVADLEVLVEVRLGAAEREAVGNFKPSQGYLRKDTEWKLSLLNL